MLSVCDSQVQYHALPSHLYCLFTGLDLSHNHLSTLPDDLSNLTLLVEFNLSSNLFQSLPSVLSQLTSLKRVDLSNNRINHINEDELCSLSRLERLDLRNNPLDDDIKEQLTTGSAAKVTTLS